MRTTDKDDDDNDSDDGNEHNDNSDDKDDLDDDDDDYVEGDHGCTSRLREYDWERFEAARSAASCMRVNG